MNDGVARKPDEDRPPPLKLTAGATRAVLLLLRYFRFVLSWLGWRKWLRAAGLLDHAYGIEGMLCGNETGRSIARAREYVFRLEESWLRANSVELLASRGHIACLYDRSRNDTTIEPNEVPSIDVSPVFRAAVRSLLADLSDLGERRRFVAGRVLVNVQNRAELYSYDYTMCSFLDETVDLMLRSLELCFTERNPFATLYETSDRLPNGGALYRLNAKLLIPLRVFGEHVLLDLDRSTQSRFMANFRRLLFDEVQLDERQLTLTNPETRKFEVLTVKENIAPDVALGSSFAHNLVRRSHVRSLLRVNYESLDAKSILIAGVLNAGRAGSANATVDTLVRAMRVGTVAVYRLVYMYRPSPPAEPAPAYQADWEGKEWRDIFRTFERMAGRRNGTPTGNWFPLNGFERVTALSLAVFKLLFERDDERAAATATDIDRACNVNRQTLMNAGWYASYDELCRDIVEHGSSRRANSAAVQNGLIFLATSVLLDVDTIFAELRSRGSCIELMLSGPHGLYLRHQRYAEMAMLLLPAECTPIHARTLDLNTLGCTGAGPNATLTLNGGRKFRLCLAFPEHRADDYRAAATQLGLATLVSDMVEHFFPKSLNVIGSGDAANYSRPPDVPSVQNVVQARVRALLAKMLSFDQFQAKGVSGSESRISRQIMQTERLVGEKYLVCSSKLWQVLRQIEATGTACRAYVRSSSMLYSPFYADRLITQAFAGLRPVCALDQSDTWKVYSYQYPRMRKTAAAAYNRFVDCRAYVLDGPGALDPLNTTGSAAGAACANSLRRKKYLDLFDEADHLISVDLANESERSRDEPPPDEVSCRENTCSSLFRRARSTSASHVTSLLCVPDRLSGNWCIYRFGDRGKFDQWTRLYESVTGVSVTSDAVPVYLLGWYIDNYNFADVNAPVVAKVSSKRLYLVNGYLAFCETPTKIVSVEPERIVKVASAFVASARNFANYNIDQRDEVCFSREVTRTDPTVQLPADHFYNRVFRPMHERNINDETLVCTLTQPSQYYYVVRLYNCRFWFPTVRLLNAAINSPDGTVCYGSAPPAIVPLLAQAVLEAASNDRKNFNR